MTRNSPPDVGQKIKALRSREKLTLDGLAKRSGVSKSMLSQIERGLTNPTLGTLWSLTQSLGIDLASLLDTPQEEETSAPEIEVVKAYQTPEIQSADGKCTLRILGPIDLVSKTEWYDMRLEAEGCLESEGHASGTTEHLTVLEGALSVRIGACVQHFEAGDTARYQADVPHFIENKGQTPARALMLVLAP
ncbi:MULTISPECIES: helix-turn-helix domain-containing protein [Kordiimonas]|jgi:transcriptional regulator with XRE-family HTH domain|uniref:helix-turn-helix domain-containing protein n=1 Tax=Kordiimonas TaxID=288021 RepID=UPI0025801ACE|nr:XRE family transcriptional regulator [Kordiimonas sp. UBA4487]